MFGFGQANSAPPVSNSDVEQQLSDVVNENNAVYDADGDGHLSELERICMKYDTNRDGNFSILEVEKIVEDMREAKKQARQMGRIAAAVFVFAVLICGALLGLMLSANEVSKESHVTGSTMVDLNGNPTMTKTLESVGTLADLVKLKAKDLTKVRKIEFQAYRKMDEDNTLFQEKQQSIEKFGLFDRIAYVTNIEQNTKTGLKISYAGGALKISLDGQIEIKENSVLYTVVVQESARRLTESHGNTMKLYPSRDAVLAAHAHHARALKNDDDTTVATVSLEASSDEQMESNTEFLDRMRTVEEDMCRSNNYYDYFKDNFVGQSVKERCNSMADYFKDNKCYDTTLSDAGWIGNEDYCLKDWNDWEDPRYEHMWGDWCYFKCYDRQMEDFDDTCGPKGKCELNSKFNNQKEKCEDAGYNFQQEGAWWETVDAKGSHVCGTTEWGVWVQTDELVEYCYYSYWYGGTYCYEYYEWEQLTPEAGPYGPYKLDERPVGYEEPAPPNGPGGGRGTNPPTKSPTMSFNYPTKAPTSSMTI